MESAAVTGGCQGFAPEGNVAVSVSAWIGG